MARLRRCVGSAKFGIESHDAPVEDFPKQPSQKDGLGRMCKKHWNAYTTALRKAALERRAAEGEATTPEITPKEVTATEDEGPTTTVVAKANGRRRATEAKEQAQEGAAG
jgi:hypothetical protein